MTDISGYYVGHLQEIVEQQRAEIERLNGRVATLVELRKFDRAEIERLRNTIKNCPPVSESEYVRRLESEIEETKL